MSRHTPGPWAIDPEEDLKTVTMSRQIEDDDGRSWEQLIAQISIIDGEDGNTNLRLILAAPDLLKAASSALEWIDDQKIESADKRLDKIWIGLVHAIRRATGGAV